jgi:hypothetical protein
VSPLKDMPPEVKSRASRRGRRVNSRVPVAVEWEEESGARLRKEGHTRVVNCYGCLVVVPCDLPFERRMRLTNLANQRSIVAVVVWRGKERVEGWELGLELVDPDMDFWGLEL